MRFHEFGQLTEGSRSEPVLLLPSRAKRWEMLKKLAREIAKASLLPKPSAADRQLAYRMFQQVQQAVDDKAERNEDFRPVALDDRMFRQ